MLGMKSKQQKEKEAFVEANRQQKDLAAENRKSAGKVIQKINSIEVCCQGLSSSAYQQVMQNILQSYVTQLDRAAANAYCELNTVDDCLQEQIHFMGDMMRENNLDGTKLASEIVADIIANRSAIGRAVNEAEAKKRYGVLEDRAKKSKAVLDAYAKCNENEKNMRHTEREIEKKTEIYNKCRDELEKVYAREEQAVRAFIEKNKLSDNDEEGFNRALDDEYNKLVILHENVMDLKNALNQYQEYEINLSAQVDNAKFLLRELDSTLDQETKETLQKVLDSHVEMMAKINDEVIELHRMREDYHNKILAVMEDTRIQMLHLENRRKAQKLLKKDWSVDEYIAGGTKMSHQTKIVQGN